MLNQMGNKCGLQDCRYTSVLPVPAQSCVKESGDYIRTYGC